MKYRKPLNRKASKKLFTKTAQRVNPKNLFNLMSRGGIRL